MPLRMTRTFDSSKASNPTPISNSIWLRPLRMFCMASNRRAVMYSGRDSALTRYLLKFFLLSSGVPPSGSHSGLESPYGPRLVLRRHSENCRS